MPVAAAEATTRTWQMGFYTIAPRFDDLALALAVWDGLPARPLP